MFELSQNVRKYDDGGLLPKLATEMSVRGQLSNTSLDPMRFYNLALEILQREGQKEVSLEDLNTLSQKTESNLANLQKTHQGIGIEALANCFKELKKFFGLEPAQSADSSSNEVLQIYCYIFLVFDTMLTDPELIGEIGSDIGGE